MRYYLASVYLRPALVVQLYKVVLFPEMCKTKETSSNPHFLVKINVRKIDN